MNILVNSGIKAAPSVPQLIIIDKTNHKGRSPIILFGRGRSPSIILLITKVTSIDKIEVIQTKDVSGASKSISSFLEYLILLKNLLIQNETIEVIIIKTRITKIHVRRLV